MAPQSDLDAASQVASLEQAVQQLTAERDELKLRVVRAEDLVQAAILSLTELTAKLGGLVR